MFGANMFKLKLTREYLTFTCVLIHIIYLAFGSTQEKTGGLTSSLEPLSRSGPLQRVNPPPLLATSGCSGYLLSDPIHRTQCTLQNTEYCKTCNGKCVGATKNTVKSGQVFGDDKPLSGSNKIGPQIYCDMYIKHLKKLKDSGRTYRRTNKYQGLSDSSKLTYLQRNPPITGSIMPDEPKVVKRRVSPTLIQEKTKFGVRGYGKDETQKIVEIIDDQDKILKKLQAQYAGLENVTPKYDAVIRELKAKLENIKAKVDRSLTGVVEPTDLERDSYVQEEKSLKGEIKKWIKQKIIFGSAKTELERAIKQQAILKKRLETGRSPSISDISTHSVSVKGLSKTLAKLERAHREISSQTKVEIQNTRAGGEHSEVYVAHRVDTHEDSDDDQGLYAARRVSTHEDSDDDQGLYAARRVSTHDDSDDDNDLYVARRVSTHDDSDDEDSHVAHRVDTHEDGDDNQGLYVARRVSTHDDSDDEDSHVAHRVDTHEDGDDDQGLYVARRVSTHDDSDDDKDLYVARRVSTHDDSDDEDSHVARAETPEDKELKYNRLCERARVLSREMSLLNSDILRRRNDHKKAAIQATSARWRDYIISKGREKASLNARSAICGRKGELPSDTSVDRPGSGSDSTVKRWDGVRASVMPNPALDSMSKELGVVRREIRKLLASDRKDDFDD